MKRSTLYKGLLAFSLLTCAGPGAPNVAAVVSEDVSRVKAAEILAKARAALGGEGKLEKITSLTVTGTYRRVVKNPEGQSMQVSGDRDLEFLFPDKFRKSESFGALGGSSVIAIQGFNGATPFTDTKSAPGRAAFVRMGPTGASQEADQLKRLQAEHARYVLALLLTATPGYDLEFSYFGEAESPDGKAEVIDASGTDGFAARLFIDMESSLPLMLSYRGAPPQGGMRMSMASGRSREEIQREAERRAEQIGAEPPELVDIHLYLSDYRVVDGVRLPHVITTAIGGETTDEFEVKRFRVNPSLKPDLFTGKKPE